MGFKFCLMLIFFVIIMSNPSLAEYYQYTDENGAVHFTDDKSAIPDAHSDNISSHESVDRKPDSKQNIDQSSVDNEIMRYIVQGSGAYYAKNFQAAIPLLSKALELYKADQTLIDDVQWRILVDNLGMSHGLTGDNTKAKEIFEYGLSEDATYPMFYYNLACAYAEMNDLDNAINNLKQAYKYKNNMIPGERLPNPATDSSFSKFLQNEKFNQSLKELNI